MLHNCFGISLGEIDQSYIIIFDTEFFRGFYLYYITINIRVGVFLHWNLRRKCLLFHQSERKIQNRYEDNMPSEVCNFEVGGAKYNFALSLCLRNTPQMTLFVNRVCSRKIFDSTSNQFTEIMRNDKKNNTKMNHVRTSSLVCSCWTISYLQNAGWSENFQEFIEISLNPEGRGVIPSLRHW